ncbi:MAG: hypothetical protein ABI781_11850 [Burkholderiales bacterium]
MISATRALAALFAAAVLTTGCGGGGGDGAPAPGPTPAPAPGSASPLALTAANASNVAGVVPAVGEAVLTIAQFAVDSTRRFASVGTSSPSVSTCPNGGLLTVTLTDRDGNGVASAGDHITVDARDCAVPLVTDIVSGTMQIELSAPTGLPADSLRAAVTLGDGLRFGATTANATSLLGSMRFDWSSTGVQTALHVTASATDDLRVVGLGAGNVALTESIRQPDLSKTLKFDEARSVVSMSFRYESQGLIGSVTVATPDPLRAYLNTYPEAGRIEVNGAAGSKVVVTPNFANNSNQYQYALDSNGDGTPDSNGSINWTDSVLGYLWWDGAAPLSGWTTNVYSTRSFATTDFFASANFVWTTSSASTFRLQFSRPPASTTPTLRFRFSDQGSPVIGSAPNADIAANADVHGALIVLSPATPLRHARYYMLQVSLDGVNWNSNVTVQDVLGNSSTSNFWVGTFITTPDNLRAVATRQAGVLFGASEQLTLNGQTSTGTPRPIVSYQWSQLSGTPLHFENATAAQTNVSWGTTPPTGIEGAVVRLTVTDASGDTDATELTIQSANLADSSHVLYFRSAAGDYIGAGATTVIGSAAAQFQEAINSGYLHASIISPGYSDWWYLDLANGDGSPLHVGTYENAIRAAFRGNQNGVDFSGNGRGCNQTVGRFDILEIQTDSSGAVTKLAVDFEQHCESATAPALLGSYRVNSSVPIRR